MLDPRFERITLSYRLFVKIISLILSGIKNFSSRRYGNFVFRASRYPEKIEDFARQIYRGTGEINKDRNGCTSFPFFFFFFLPISKRGYSGSRLERKFARFVVS